MVTVEQFEQIIFEIFPDKAASQFDLILLADGAGSTIRTSAGWHIYSYEPSKKILNTYYGGVSNGTNNYAELAPFIHALWIYDKTYKDVKSPVQPQNILLISDSEVTVKCGNLEYSRRENQPLWRSIEYFEKGIYQLYWKWIPRNSNLCSIICDEKAKKIRELIHEF